MKREIKNTKNTQLEFIDMKNVIFKINNSLDGLKRRLDSKEKISQFEDTNQNMQNEAQGEQKSKKWSSMIYREV